MDRINVKSETNIKNETTISGSGFEMDDKTNMIKVKANISDATLENESQCFYKSLERDLNSDVTVSSNFDFKLDNKTNIKEEPGVDTELANVEYVDCTNLATVTGNGFKKHRKIECRVEEFVSDVTSHSDSKGFSVDPVTKIKKTNVICSGRDINENEESDLEAAEDLSPLESPRCTKEVTNHNMSSHTFPCTSDTVSEKNVDKETSITPQISSLNCYPMYEHFEPEETVCGENTNSQQVLNRHSSNDSQRKSYKCEVCGKCFIQKSHLKSHSLIHSGIKQYKCHECDMCFTWKPQFKRHALLHSGTTPYKCEICQKCFTQRSSLKSHAFLHSGIKPYKCEHCGKCFTEKSNLKSHTLVHLATKPYKCEKCDKGFTWKSQFKRHTLLHSGTPPYKCEHCEKCFSQITNLKLHTLIHSGIKPFKCEHCDRCFSWQSSLKAHTLVHSSTKAYRCENCDKCFKRRTALNKHRLMHLGTKP